MLKFLSKVRIEFNALDPRTASCMEFLAQCNARKAKESNPACQLQIKRRTDDHPPQISVTFVNGVEEVFDATSTPAQTIRNMILEKGQFLETEQMFSMCSRQRAAVSHSEFSARPPNRRIAMERLAQCHCGSLRARTSGEPLAVAICHCQACQDRKSVV